MSNLFFSPLIISHFPGLHFIHCILHVWWLNLNEKMVTTTRLISDYNYRKLKKSKPTFQFSINLLDKVLESITICPLFSKRGPMSDSGKVAQSQTVLHALISTRHLLLFWLKGKGQTENNFIFLWELRYSIMFIFCTILFKVKYNWLNLHWFEEVPQHVK